MKSLNKSILIGASLIGLLTSCSGLDVYNERIKNYINEMTNKTSNTYRYYNTYDRATGVSTEYFIYYNFQMDYSGLFITSITGGLETGVEITLPRSNSSIVSIFMIEFYNNAMTFNGESVINPSELNVESEMSFTNIIFADAFARENIEDYNKRMSLGVHLNLMAFETKLGNVLDFSLKDLGFTNYSY